MTYENLSLVILSWFYFAHYYLFWLGIFNGAFLLSFDAEDDSNKKVYFALVGVISAIPGSAILALPILANLTGTNVKPTIFFGLLWLACAAISWVGAFWWLRYGVQKYEKVAKKLTKASSLERNKRTDVRNIHNFMPEEALMFDPLKYMNKQRGVFLGLEEQGQPTYIEFGGGTSAPHVQVVGTTGAGKGVSLGVMASQFMERDEAVFFCDPKNDEWAPHVMYNAAILMGKPYYFINLNRPNGPQFNLAEDATEEEMFELFQAGLGLTDKGDSSDFYGIDDRDHADRVSRMIANEGLTIADAFVKSIGMREEGDEAGKKFYGKLKEAARVPSINALAGGVSLAEVVEKGGCVYIVGSMRNDIIKMLQKMILIRLIQLAERRDRMKGELRNICIVLDEVKYHLSKPALEALGAARDKGVHLVLAHQSLGDLKDCTKDMNSDAVVDAVVENCRIKVCYKVQSPDTAEWLSKMSGKILVDDESRQVNKNIALSETMEGDRRISQAERYYIDENMLLNLPSSLSVLYGSGLPKFVSIRPLKVPKSVEAIKIVEVQGGSVKTTSDKIEELIDIEDGGALELPLLE